MNPKFKNSLIGLFVLSAILLISWLLVFLKPTFGDGGKLIKARFVEIEKIGIGTRVTLAGKPVGEVIEIYPVSNARAQSRAKLGNHVYSYELLLRLDSKTRIFPDDIVTPQTSGLLGERSIAIIPQRIHGEDVEPISESEVIYAHVSPSMEDAFQKFARVAYKSENAIDQINELLATTTPHLETASASLSSSAEAFKVTFQDAQAHKLVQEVSAASRTLTRVVDSAEKKINTLFTPEFLGSIQRTMLHAESILAAVDDPTRLKNTLAQTNAAMEGLNLFQKNLNEAWPDLQNAISRIYGVADNLEQFSFSGKNVAENLDEILSRLSSGEGTLGKLLMEDNLYLSTMSIMTRANILIRDINDYGLLFHNSRQWRNARTEELGKIQRLRNPKAFENYYDDQLSDIYLSLGKIQELLNEAQNRKNRSYVVKTEGFSDEFTKLIKQLSTLKEQMLMFKLEMDKTPQEK